MDEDDTKPVDDGDSRDDEPSVSSERVRTDDSKAIANPDGKGNPDEITGSRDATDSNSGDVDDVLAAGTTGQTSDGGGSEPTSRDRSSPEVDIGSMVLDDEGEDDKGLFDDLLSGEPIFENKEVLRPSYTPHKLPHRSDQINQMATILVSALRGETPSNILIYGKTGTGKTASAKFVSQELESTSQKYDVPCDVEYINCEVTDTQYRVLAQLANKFIEKNQNRIQGQLERLRELRSDVVRDGDLQQSMDGQSAGLGGQSAGSDEQTAGSDGQPADSEEITVSEFDSVEELDERIEGLEADAEGMKEVPMTGWPTDRVYSTFFEAIDYRERVVVIMLDEIDKLVEKSGDDTLYNLSRMNSELDNSRISIMGISNDLKFTDFLDPRVKSSLGEEEIVFPPYDANQLRDILQHRADVAFKSDALTEDVIPLCAAFAAQEHGDARRALDLLRTAGELAERSQADLVREEHVRQAQDKIELDRVVEVVRTLPTQSKIVLFSIILLEKNGVHNINTGEVFNIYKRLCEEIDADVLTQRRVTDLISELDMLGIVNAVVVSKGRYGRTKEMNLSVPIEETEAVLLSDSRLGDIENAQPFVQARFDN
ncbi:orc1/cdc6 family replication initiation protein [Halalkaliarchaeum sp. AArc-GB]|uniref:Cdc6/Cdc18 family protein n=1 Tax=unclassified Halalkaliarchaeum TaxID=2678344 RepID=UPI00217DDACD|nr:MULTISPECIES: orc1/cdc6 family replication initiation protein [unclassified Halalkaliarchaeum]MDR5672761.1 orc1/cdc6 family replication initiation protein [Halalkaliarchaeum sp. AArc-GB]